MGPLSDQELEGKDPSSNHRAYPNPTSCKRTPGPGLHRGTEHEKAAQPGELAWRSGREQEEGGAP